MRRSSLSSGAYLLDEFISPLSHRVVSVHEASVPGLGRIRAGATARGVCFIELKPETEQTARRWRDAGYEIRKSVAPLRELFRQLREYGSGKHRQIDIEVDLPLETPFTRRILKAVARIPYGSTVTYGEIARRIGCPSSSRAVGGAVGRNPVPVIIPCHRVVASSGLGGFSCGVEMKKKLLLLEER